jgi:glycosyltransferase involved in cell wall biosynthesis
MSAAPTVSVVICTRNRPDDLARCLGSLADLSPGPAEVIVVDQGDSKNLPSPSSQIPELYHHMAGERGLSRARNVGIALSRGDVVAFLDDDCTVEPSWASDVAAVFARHPDAGLVFGSVADGISDPDQYVPAYAVKRERTLRGRFAAVGAHGIGAGMYLRRALARSVGNFDVRLGAGGEFQSSEDWDYTFRMLSAGHSVVETPAITVLHHGGRSYADGSAASMLRSNAFSHGVVHAKLLRCLDPIAPILIAGELWSSALLLRPWAALRGRPTNAGRLVSYWNGLIAGLRVPIDRAARVFVPSSQNSIFGPGRARPTR